MKNKSFIHRKVTEKALAATGPKKPKASKSKEKTKFRLRSAEFVNAPGLVRWAINGYAFPRDRKVLLNVIVSTWSLPKDVAHALLLGRVPFTVDGETVEFEA